MKNIEDIVKTAEKYGKNILFVATPYKYSRSRFPYQCALNAYMEKMQYWITIQIFIIRFM